MRKSRVLAVLPFVSCLLLAPAVGAQSAPPKPAAGQSAEKLAEAKQHYEAGLRLYDAEDYDAARVEFERAYALTPNYRILYNLGLILKLRSDYVGALKNFELYLEEGVDAPEARRNEVRNELTALRKLVAQVEVTTNVPDADISVDDVVVAKSPISKPILVNPGRRRISATKKGRVMAIKAVDIVSRDKVSVFLELGEEKQIIVLEKSRRYPWVLYGITGALAITAGITGYVSLNASNNLKDERDRPNQSPDRLETLSSRVTTFGLVADISGLAAIVAGGFSLYYTIKWGREASEPAPKSANATPSNTTTVRFLPGGVYGSF